MIGIDTNVLARLFVDDNVEQARAARQFVEERCTSDDPGFVDRVALCEMVWVLTSAHGYDRPAVVRVIEKLLASNEIILEDEEPVRTALDIFARRGVDFADALIGQVNHARGCDATVTFDRRAARLDGFVKVA